MRSAMPTHWAMTLETVIEKTGELDHLFALVERRCRAAGVVAASPDASAAAIVEEVINPLLAELECHLRGRLSPAMAEGEVKALIAAWIDDRIAELEA
ncbi:MAG: hypothetical protein GKC04_07465 [Methanomicrobiales archaeon]|nr:hypothetical protein [Methanomicrobiales archaeon]